MLLLYVLTQVQQVLCHSTGHERYWIIFIYRLLIVDMHFLILHYYAFGLCE